MAAPSDIFNPAKTHCPSCNGTLAAPTDRCPLCGFTAAICVQRYPFEPPPLARFVDPHGAISSGDRRTLSKAFNRFEKRFPQITVSTCVTNLPKGVDGREFGFWLFNRSQPQSDRGREQRPYVLLLVVDSTSKTLSVTAGYGLDCFLDDVVLSKSLTDAEGAFRQRGLSSGISRWLKVLERRLIDVHEDAQYAEDRWKRRAIPSNQPAALPVPGTQTPPRQTVTEGYREIAVEDSSPAPTQQRELQQMVSTKQY